ncbi:NAD(P)H-dependent oxidoreductase subunit E [bacterium]|nr:NAD(P)H-dependent oxidoreductase subunit E [bacterium]
MKKEIEKVIEEYKGDREALLPILKKIQERFKHIPEKYIVYLSKRLNIPMAEIYSVLTFYGLLTLKKEGKFAIKVCNSVTCYLKGSKKIIESVKEELNINPGEKTKDGLFSLDVVGCLGLCDGSPAMLINDKVFTNLTPDKVKEIIRNIKERQQL